MIESGNKEIYIVCGAADMRKGVDGLAAIVNLRLACDFSGASMFIFHIFLAIVVPASQQFAFRIRLGLHQA